MEQMNANFLDLVFPRAGSFVLGSLKAKTARWWSTRNAVHRSRLTVHARDPWAAVDAVCCLLQNHTLQAKKGPVVTPHNRAGNMPQKRCIESEQGLIQTCSLEAPFHQIRQASLGSQRKLITSDLRTRGQSCLGKRKISL